MENGQNKLLIMTNFEIFFDGACNPTNPGGHMGYGYIIYKEGDFIDNGSFYEEKNPNNTNNVAEYKACLEAFHRLIFYIEEENISNFSATFFGDSKLVIEQMSGRWGIKKGQYKEFALKLKSLIQGYDFDFTWIPREQNTEADELSVRELELRGINRTY